MRASCDFSFFAGLEQDPSAGTPGVKGIVVARSPRSVAPCSKSIVRSQRLIGRSRSFDPEALFRCRDSHQTRLYMPIAA